MVRGYADTNRIRSLKLMCQIAYKKARGNTPTKITVRRCECFKNAGLVIPAYNNGYVLLDVLKCEMNGSNSFYITKGRRDTSVYFLNEVGVDVLAEIRTFALDESFASDI